jgi:hypothetical protein
MRSSRRKAPLSLDLVHELDGAGLPIVEDELDSMDDAVAAPARHIARDVPSPRGRRAVCRGRERDDEELAVSLRIEERELEVGGRS